MSWVAAGWAALVVAGALLALLLAARTGRRLLVTAAVGLKYVALGLAQATGLRRLRARLAGDRYDPLTPPEAMRRAFEDLGPTYIKLGQIIASSPGLFTRPYVEAFRRCLDAVPPIPGDAAMRVLREELGERAAAITVEPEPLASASVAQVHGARGPGGEDLVVKIQRPGIAGRISADITIMRRLAQVVALSPSARLANPVGVVEDFGTTIREELDFVQEGRNMDRFNRIMAELGHGGRILAPRVDWDLTTRRLLTMERLHGHNVDDVEAVKRSHLDAEEMLILGMRAWFQCVMLYGFFHGDVHAGNLMWLDDGRIAFLDFGIVGRFTPEQRQLVTRYVLTFFGGDYRGLARVIIEMGGVDGKAGDGDVDEEAFARDLEQVYGPLRQVSFAEIRYGEVAAEILAVARRHRAHMPREFILIVKQVLYFDRYAKLLAPKLNIFADPRLMPALAMDVQRAMAGEGPGAGGEAGPPQG